MNDIGFIIRHVRGKEVAQYFSSAEKQELSTQNSTLSENILQMKGE